MEKANWKIATSLFILFIPFSWAQVAIGSIYRILTIILVGYVLLKSKGKFFIKKSNEKGFGSFFVYIFYCTITNFWNKSFNSGILNSMGLGLIFIVFFIFATERYTKDYQRFLEKCWIIVGFLSVILFKLGRTSVGEYGSRTSLKLLGTATDPNEFSGLFIISIGFTLLFFLQVDKLIKKLALGLLIFMQLYVTILSGSRGSLISVIFMMIYTFILNKKINVKLLLKFLILVVILCLLLYKLIIPIVPEDILNRLSIQALIIDGGSGRSDIWKDALEQMISGSIINFIFGHGVDGILAGGIHITRTMHNQFVQNFVCYGCIGLILYVNFIFNIFKLLNKYNKKYIGIFFGMLIMSMTITMGPSYKPLWLFMYMALVHPYKKRRKLELDEKIFYNYS